MRLIVRVVGCVYSCASVACLLGKMDMDMEVGSVPVGVAPMMVVRGGDGGGGGRGGALRTLGTPIRTPRACNALCRICAMCEYGCSFFSSSVTTVDMDIPTDGMRASKSGPPTTAIAPKRYTMISIFG